MRAFSEEHDISATNLGKWKQRYAEPRSGNPSFVELKAMPMPGGSGDFDYELELAGGHTLRLRRGFDGREIETLVAALAR